MPTGYQIYTPPSAPPPYSHDVEFEGSSIKPYYHPVVNIQTSPTIWPILQPVPNSDSNCCISCIGCCCKTIVIAAFLAISLFVALLTFAYLLLRS